MLRKHYILAKDAHRPEVALPPTGEIPEALGTFCGTDGNASKSAVSNPGEIVDAVLAEDCESQEAGRSPSSSIIGRGGRAGGGVLV